MNYRGKTHEFTTHLKIPIARHSNKEIMGIYKALSICGDAFHHGLSCAILGNIDLHSHYFLTNGKLDKEIKKCTLTVSAH